MTHAREKLWHAAVHEAGHAIIDHMLGLSCGHATLVPDYEEDAADVAYFFDALQACGWKHLHRSREDRAFWHGKIIASMAGAEAEREIIGWCAGGEEHDQRQCNLIGGDLGYSDDWPKRATRLRRFARQLVKRHRDATLRFAEQLIALDELSELLAR